jgi:transposase-like protein
MKQLEQSTEIVQNLNNVIKIDEFQIKQHLGELVRSAVEDTLNAMLDAQADQLCNASRYEHSESRIDTRAGFYSRKFQTKAGQVNLNMPKLRKTVFETAIIERYKRRESSIEEALIEMYLAGVSTRRIEDITEALWGTKVSPSTVSNLNQKAYENIEKWRNRPLTGSYPYVYLDGIVLKRSWAGEVKNVSVLVAIAVDQEGYREVLGSWEGPKEDREGWGSFLKHLKSRGLRDTRLFITDKCLGLVESLNEYYPEAQWQRCTVHWYRNVFGKVPRQKITEVAKMLKAIHSQEDKEAAREKAKGVIGKLLSMKLRDAAKIVEEGHLETMSYYDFPSEHWSKLRTNNGLERMMKEIRRRTRVVGSFPDGHSALMLATARLRYISGTKWGTKRYLDMDKLYEQEKEQKIDQKTG